MVGGELSARGAGQAGHLLIVDDVADNRAILARRFQRHGFEVTEADSGRAALDLIARSKFDTVLLDVLMPDMNGLDVLKQIRARASGLELPVIMVTGRTASQDIVDALSAGANDYITKPVDFAVALLRVTNQIGRQQAEERVRRANQQLSEANESLERRIAERTAELLVVNEQLRAAIAQAEAANRAKDEFLITVSHELRTPLNGLISMAQMLAQTSLNEKQYAMTTIINEFADQLHKVIMDMLDMLALVSGTLRLTPRRARPAQAANAAADGVREMAERKGLTLRVEIAPAADGEMELDPDRLAQVLTKLLDNGVKFTERGEIVLALAREAAGDGALEGALRIEVRDTGIGMDAETAAKVFQPFVQADGSLSRRFEGLGLGLAICHGLVSLMAGRLEVESEPGRGSCFRLILPTASAGA